MPIFVNFFCQKYRNMPDMSDSHTRLTAWSSWAILWDRYVILCWYMLAYDFDTHFTATAPHPAL
jgi:hypothetical protein